MTNRDPDPETSSEDGLPRHILRLADPGAPGIQPFDISPDDSARAAVARALGIPAVRKLRFSGRMIPSGRRDWTLEATLGATVVQECGVTLAPVVGRIDEPVQRRYLADLPAPLPGEVEMPEDDSIEELPASLDLCAVMIEALALALPPFPRAPGASLGDIAAGPPGAHPLGAAEVRPFAALSSLRDRLTDKDGDGVDPGGTPDPD